MVAKKLAADCLLADRLHSQVRDRLKTIQQLASPSVAHLYGVERMAEGSFILWQHLPGQTLGEWAAQPHVTHQTLLRTLRDLVVGIEGIHALGIVHGQLHSRNVFIGNGTLHLTHFSELLYTDPAEDAQALVQLIRLLLATRGEETSPLAQFADRAERETPPLPQIRLALGGLIDGRDVQTPTPPAAAAELTPRGRSTTGAIVVALLGVLIAWALWQFAPARRPAQPPPVPPARLNADPSPER